MKYTLLSILLFACTVNAFSNTSELTPQNLCPVAEKLYSKYCQSNSTFTCNKLDTFINNYCHNILDRYSSFNPHELCPLVNLFDKLLCSSYSEITHESLNPKDLCPLFDYVDNKYCQSKMMHFSSNDSEFTCVLACKPLTPK